MKPVKKEKHTPKHYLPDTTPKIAAAGATVLVLLVVLSFVLSSYSERSKNNFRFWQKN